MGWFDALFGDDRSDAPARRRERDDGPADERDPFGRLLAEPAFDALRSAWRAGASLFDLFGDKPVAIAQTVGPKAPNRRPDVTKVETYLDRTGQYAPTARPATTAVAWTRASACFRRPMR